MCLAALVGRPLFNAGAQQGTGGNVPFQEMEETGGGLLASGDGQGIFRFFRRPQTACRLPPDIEQGDRREGEQHPDHPIAADQRHHPFMALGAQMAFLKQHRMGSGPDQPGQQVALPINGQGLVAQVPGVGQEHQHAVADPPFGDHRFMAGGIKRAPFGSLLPFNADDAMPGQFVRQILPRLFGNHCHSQIGQRLPDKVETIDIAKLFHPGIQQGGRHFLGFVHLRFFLAVGLFFGIARLGS